MQKGVFLLEMRGPSEWRELFNFEPYDWGPYSRDLASTVEDLVDRSALVRVQVPRSRYRAYEATRLGDEMVGHELTDQEAVFVRSVRHFVTTRSFSKLLKDVYAAFPEFAAKSRFRG